MEQKVIVIGFDEFEIELSLVIDIREYINTNKIDLFLLYNFESARSKKYVIC